MASEDDERILFFARFYVKNNSPVRPSQGATRISKSAVSMIADASQCRFPRSFDALRDKKSLVIVLTRARNGAVEVNHPG